MKLLGLTVLGWEAAIGVGFSGRTFVGVPLPLAWPGVGLVGRIFDVVLEIGI